MRLKSAVFVFLLAAFPVSADDFLKEDWTLTAEPTHMDYWGTCWGVTNFMLPFRATTRRPASGFGFKSASSH